MVVARMVSLGYGFDRCDQNSIYTYRREVSPSNEVMASHGSCSCFSGTRWTRLSVEQPGVPSQQNDETEVFYSDGGAGTCKSL